MFAATDNTGDEYADSADANDMYPSQTIVSIIYADSKLGVSIYKELTNEILCDCMQVNLNDIKDTITSIKSSCDPTMFLIHPLILSNEPLLQFLLFKDTPDNVTRDTNATATATDASAHNNCIDEAAKATDVYRYTVLKSQSWNLVNAMELIRTRLTVKESQQQVHQGVIDMNKNYYRICSLIDLNNTKVCQSLGALLTYMQTNIFHLENGNVIVSKVSTLPVGRYMHMDMNTFTSLQIFSKETHPNMLDHAGQSKEGFSLFSLIDRTKSLPGRQRLRDWMSKPFYDITLITQRQMGVGLVVNRDNRDFLTIISKYLRHIHNLPRILLRIKKVEATYIEWCRLYTTLSSANPIINELYNFINNRDKRSSEKEYIAQHLLNGYDSNVLDNLQKKLNTAIDFDKTYECHNMVFQRGYDEVLDSMMDIFDNLDCLLVTAAHQLLQLCPLLQTISVEYVPQIGFLTAIQRCDSHFLNTATTSDGDVDGADGISENIEDDNAFTFIYCQDDTSYYKHKVMYDMDDEIGDIKSNIADRARLLLLDLEEEVLACEDSFQTIASILESLDATVSLGLIAIEHNFTCPEMVEDDVIIIKNGRHPIASLYDTNFVPNDTYITGEKNVVLITGSNNSGKSVCLKQVGLLVYLAHIGSYIPCEKAIIGLTDMILTRISTTESVSSFQSSFQADLSQINTIMTKHTSKSLCLVDEFGKGTSPIDGISLLATTIKTFTYNKAKVMFVLHFIEILHPDIITTNEMNSITSLCMEITTNSDDMQNADDTFDDDDGIQMIPLYKLKLGTATSSHGITCAKQGGLSSSIIARCLAVREAILNNQTIAALKLKTNTVINKDKCVLIEKFLDIDDWIAADRLKLIDIKNNIKRLA